MVRYHDLAAPMVQKYISLSLYLPPTPLSLSFSLQACVAREIAKKGRTWREIWFIVLSEQSMIPWQWTRGSCSPNLLVRCVSRPCSTVYYLRCSLLKGCGQEQINLSTKTFFMVNQSTLPTNFLDFLKDFVFEKKDVTSIFPLCLGLDATFEVTCWEHGARIKLTWQLSISSLDNQSPLPTNFIDF